MYIWLLMLHFNCFVLLCFFLLFCFLRREHGRSIMEGTWKEYHMSVDILNAKPVLFVLCLGKHWYHPSKTAKASKAVSRTDHRKKDIK